MAEKVLIDDLETSDEDIFLGVTYRGKPFTGTAVDTAAASPAIRTDRWRMNFSSITGK